MERSSSRHNSRRSTSLDDEYHLSEKRRRELEEKRREWRREREREKEHERLKRRKIEEYEQKRAAMLREQERKKALEQSSSSSKEGTPSAKTLFGGLDNTKLDIDEQELHRIVVNIKRKNVPTSTETLETSSNELKRNILNPEDVRLLRREGEGSKPIFDREELKKEHCANVDEERTVRVRDAEKPSVSTKIDSPPKSSEHSRKSRNDEDSKYDDRGYRRSDYRDDYDRSQSSSRRRRDSRYDEEHRSRRSRSYSSRRSHHSSRERDTYSGFDSSHRQVEKFRRSRDEERLQKPVPEREERYRDDYHQQQYPMMPYSQYYMPPFRPMMPGPPRNFPPVPPANMIRYPFRNGRAFPNFLPRRGGYYPDQRYGGVY